MKIVDGQSADSSVVEIFMNGITECALKGGQGTTLSGERKQETCGFFPYR